MIKYNDKTYRVRFLYATKTKDKEGFDFGGKALNDIRDKHIWTICEIQEKVEGEEQWKGIAGSYVIRNPADSFSKPHGRRAVLANSLCQIKDVGIRQTIWEYYFDVHKDYNWDTYTLPKLSYNL